MALRGAPGLARPVAGAVITLTRRCNEACAICLEPEFERGTLRDVSADDALALAEYFGGRVPTVMSCAGEPILYPHFNVFAREISSRGSFLEIGTNGLAFAREEVLNQALDAGLRGILWSCHALRPGDFDELTGTRGKLPTYKRALQNVRAAMESMPRLEVTLEVVLTRRLVGRVGEFLDAVRELFPGRLPGLRVETMRWMNRALHHPGLRPDLDEVRATLDEFLARALPDFGLLFAFVPLCLLPGHESRANEPRRILARDVWLGNQGVGSLEIVEYCRLGNPVDTAAGRGSCGHCPLSLVCPGFTDLALPPEGPLPGPATLTLEQLATHPDVAPPGGLDAGLLEAVRADRLSCTLDGGCFPDREAVRLAEVESWLRRRGVQALIGTGRLVVQVPDDAQPEGPAQVVVTMAREGEPCHVRCGSLAVFYNGLRTPRVERAVRVVVALLERNA